MGPSRGLGMNAECGLAANALGALVLFVGVGGGGAGSFGLKSDALVLLLLLMLLLLFFLRAANSRMKAGTSSLGLGWCWW